MAEKKEETGLKTIIVTAVVTAILTSLTQYFLQKDKLTSEQDYWRKRYQIESVDKINSQRLQMVEELNKDLLQLEVKAKEIKINTAASKYYTKPEEMQELNALMVQYHKDLYLYAAKMQMASFYFGNEVNALIPKVDKALELNFQNNLLTKKNGVPLPEFELNFETIDTLINTRLKLTKAMVEEIANSYKIKDQASGEIEVANSWTNKDWLNLLLSIVIAFLTAYLYEFTTNRRRQNKFRKTFSFLESQTDKYDWQHWNVKNGKIEDQPIDAFMLLKYTDNRNFLFTWKEPGSDKVQGDGYIFWQDLTHGKMSFHRYESLDYNYRNVFYREIKHKENTYDAIFVNADDEKTKYVMLRKK